jgi:hypothetical protein
MSAIPPLLELFDEQKLAWVNATHLRALSNEELWKRVEPLSRHPAKELR